MAALMAWLELLDSVCPSGAAHPAVVDVAEDFCAAPEGKDPIFLLLVAFWRLLDPLGVQPDLRRCAVCGETTEGGGYDPRAGQAGCARHRPAGGIALDSAVLEWVGRLDRPWRELAEEVPSSEARKILGRIVDATYTLHVDGYRRPRSLRWLRG
jgi:recombinational DNA repair protein (RecF pathway)